MPIERAILSVSDKTGIIDLARALTNRGVEILSTGGTAAHLAKAGVPVTPIASWSGAPEILGGRVKTLTPKVFGAILADRSRPEHLDECSRHGIPSIDLVVVNLYPFAATVARERTASAEAIEQIDIGGPSMLRAAAKNHMHVLPLPSPSMYAPFLDELAAGDISEVFRKHAAVTVFRMTAAYDAAIAAYLCGEPGSDSLTMPDSFTIELAKFQDLRYGENPRQLASFYAAAGAVPFRQLTGKELSYNNLLDLDAAIRLAHHFEEPACAVIKHTNPCGVARHETIAEALRSAIEADPVAAFGGIIGLNREMDAASASHVATLFLEVIVAPAFSSEAIAILSRKKNLRLVIAAPATGGFDFRSACGGVLAQTADTISRRDGWKTVTGTISTDTMDTLELAWIVSANVKSNAIVLANGGRTTGVGAGQMSRVDAARVAIMKALSGSPERTVTAGTVAASDAFFPFRDGIDVLADAGVTAVIQPGGSVRDDEVVGAATERGVSMVFTGERHFRH